MVTLLTYPVERLGSPARAFGTCTGLEGDLIGRGRFECTLLDQPTFQIKLVNLLPPQAVHRQVSGIYRRQQQAWRLVLQIDVHTRGGCHNAHQIAWFEC